MQTRISPLVVAAFLTASCSGNDAGQNLTQPTATSTSSSVAVSTTSAMIVAQPVSNPVCPSVAPFNVPLVVVVQPNGGFSFVVTSINVRFVDTAGVAMPQMQLPAPVPTTQFGTALDNARSQAFPVSLGIGCATGHKGNVEIVVQTRDAFGRSGMGRATVSVR